MHGLFSHLSADHAETRPGVPVGQRSYTDLFREPVASPQSIST
ncbi:hypothetical protein [Lentzea cavernae]|nr:hypothetical protein [Lentzea cavernae]